MELRKLRLALLISGGGSTMQAILQACNDGTLTGIDPVLVIASDPNAGGIQKAADLIGEERVAVVQNKPPNDTDFGARILAECRLRGVDWIGQYGWLPHTPDNVIHAYRGRIINQHPGPLQGDGTSLHFGGKGLYGLRVHYARLRFVQRTNRAFWTRVVAHFVIAGEGYDDGLLIHDAEVPILPGDTAETLQARALPIEHAVQMEALRKIVKAKGVPPTFKYYNPLVEPHEIPIFEEVLRETAEHFRRK